MADWTENDLDQQFKRAQNSGWLLYFEVSGQQHNFVVELLLAIASRETDLQNIRGDFHDGSYHGYGIMQVDIGTDPQVRAAWTRIRYKSPSSAERRYWRGNATTLLEKASLI
jgi:hypothetical protein